MMMHSFWFFFWVWWPCAVATSQEDDDDDVGLLQANIRQLSSVDKLTGGTCQAWFEDNKCPFGSEARSVKTTCAGASCINKECCDADKFAADCEANSAKMDRENEKMVADAKAEVLDAAKADDRTMTMDDVVEPEKDVDETEEAEDVDDAADADFQKKVQAADDEISKCFKATEKKIKDRNDKKQAKKLGQLISAEVKLKLKKDGDLEDDDEVYQQIDGDDDKITADEFVNGELDGDTSDLQFEAEDEDGTSGLLEIVTERALGGSGLKVKIDEEKLTALKESLDTALELCKVDDKKKAEIKDILAHLEDPVKLRERAKGAGINMDKADEVTGYITDLKRDFDDRLKKLALDENEVESKCRKEASKLDLNVFDSVYLKAHGSEDCSKLLLEQLRKPKHRQRAADKWRQAAELAFIFQGSDVDVLKLRDGLSLHSLTPTQHLRSRMLPKDGKVCTGVRETLNRDSHRHLADDEETQSYVDCLCLDQHHPQICHMHHAHVLRQMAKAHVSAGAAEARRMAAQHKDEHQALSSVSSINQDETEDAAEIEDTEGRKVGVGPCIFEAFFSGKICMSGLCAESGPKFASESHKKRSQYAKSSKHLKAMGIWDGRKSVFDQAKAALDYIANRQGGPSSDFDVGLDCFDISATVCLGLQPGEKLTFKFTIGWKLPGSCFKGLKGLVENHIYMNFDICIGTGLAFIKGPLAVLGLDCFNIVSIKIYLTLNVIHVEVTVGFAVVRGQITGQAALGPMASGLVSDYCYSVSGGKKTCYRRSCSWNRRRRWWGSQGPCSNVPYRCAGNQGAYNNCYKGYEDKRKAQIVFAKQVWVPYVRYNRRRRWLGSISAGGNWKSVLSHTIPC